MTGEVPQDPVTELGAAAAQQHELSMSWVAAGSINAQAWSC